MNTGRPQSSILVDLKDPIQVHLLTETALADSKEFEILSQEEVDYLKKQCQALSQRIEQTRANLAIQSKYRDAAISMSKLYSPIRPESRRRSLLSNRNSGAENAKEAEAERQASERKCEELSSELWSLEKRLIEPQRRLLHHTAGILQLTHHETNKKTQPSGVQQPAAGLSGMPGSPESMYTYSNGRDSDDDIGSGPDINHLEEPYGGSQDNVYNAWDRNSTQELPPFGPPMRSPVRGQARELRTERDRLREENGRLQQESDQLRQDNLSLSSKIAAIESDSSKNMRTIEETEQRLQDLNARLRDIILQMNPTNSQSYPAPPTGLKHGTERAPQSMNMNMIGSQIDYLQDGLAKIGGDSAAQVSEATLQVEKMVETVNQKAREIVARSDPSYPIPPSVTGPSMLDEKLDYLQSCLCAVEGQMNRATELFTVSSDDRQKKEQLEAVIMGLWDIIQSGLAEAVARKRQLRRATFKNGSQDDEDVSDMDDFDLGETYSLQAFSTKVQWLYARASGLAEQKMELQRQIKQQRELNSKSDAEKEFALRNKDEEIMTTQNMLAEAVMESNDVRAQLMQAMSELENSKATTAKDDAVAREQTEQRLKESMAKISQLEKSAVDLQEMLSRSEKNAETLSSQLTEASAAKKAAEAALEEKQKEIKAKEEDMDKLSTMVVEIKTELTIAQAELDGAYGSRAERAAKVAALSSNADTTQLQDRVKELETELASTLKEFEDVTKETIDQEKEKLELEGRLDDAVSARSQLESEVKALRDQLDKEVGDGMERLAKLQEELDREKLKAPPEGRADGGGLPSARPGAGASMLSEQFRATMREERKKFQEDLRVKFTFYFYFALITIFFFFFFF